MGGWRWSRWLSKLMWASLHYIIWNITKHISFMFWKYSFFCCCETRNQILYHHCRAQLCNFFRWISHHHIPIVANRQFLLHSALLFFFMFPLIGHLCSIISKKSTKKLQFFLIYSSLYSCLRLNAKLFMFPRMIFYILNWNWMKSLRLSSFVWCYYGDTTWNLKSVS